MRLIRLIQCVAPVLVMTYPLVAPAQPRKPAKPFTVTGTVVDTKGRPLEGVTVWINADFVYGRASATTGPDGRYAFSELLRATYRADAWVKVPYAGGSVCQRLAMPKPGDYNSFPVSGGAVRDFRWQLTGKIGFTDSYFGASIRIWDLDNTLGDARSVVFKLTPVGPLIDGSPGTVIVKEAVLDYPSSDDGLDDLPLGTYKMTAIMVGKDGRKSPLLAAPLGSETFRPEIDLVWRAEPRCGFGSDSGVAPFGVSFRRAG
jgi:Carboxypeptidase regulatory-like domain